MEVTNFSRSHASTLRFQNCWSATRLGSLRVCSCIAGISTARQYPATMFDPFRVKNSTPICESSSSCGIEVGIHFRKQGDRVEMVGPAIAYTTIACVDDEKSFSTNFPWSMWRAGHRGANSHTIRRVLYLRSDCGSSRVFADANGHIFRRP